jgi:hypothetical protein
MNLPRLALLAAVMLSGCDSDGVTRPAERAVDDFHRRLDSVDFAGVVSAAHPEFKNAPGREVFIRHLADIHSKLGEVRKAHLYAWHSSPYDNSHPHAPKPELVLYYKTRFAHGEGDETFGYLLSDGSARLRSYHFMSDKLE